MTREEWVKQPLCICSSSSLTCILPELIFIYLFFFKCRGRKPQTFYAVCSVSLQETILDWGNHKGSGKCWGKKKIFILCLIGHIKFPKYMKHAVRAQKLLTLKRMPLHLLLFGWWLFPLTSLLCKAAWAKAGYQRTAVLFHKPDAH